MKLCIRFFILISVSFCFAQNGLPNDWILNGLKGKVKSVEEVVNITDLPSIKKVYNFDKNGLLTTVMEFSEYLLDKDSLIHNTIYRYKNDSIQRRFTVYDVKTHTIKSIGVHNVLNPNIYTLEVEMENNMFSYSEFKFEDGILSSRKNKIMNEDNVEFINSDMEYFYTNDVLSKIKITHNLEKIEGFTSIKTIEIDKLGNFIIQQYFDEKETMLYEVKRKLAYYD